MEKYDWKKTIHGNIIILKILGLWPPGNESYTLSLYTIYSFSSILAFNLGHNFFQTINVLFVFPDLEAISGTFFVTLSDLLATVKAYYLIQNMKVLKRIMVDLNQDLFQPRNLRQIKMIQPSLNFWKIISRILWTISSGAVFFWATYPILDGSVSQKKLPFLAWYPYDYKISPYYEITYIYQIISVAFIAASILSMDTLITALNMFIGAQCDILCDELKRIFTTQDFAKRYKNFLTCIQHHREILKFARDSNNFFNWIVLMQFFISAATIGITMFQLTITEPFTSEFFSQVAFLTAITIEIFMYCWFGNEVEVKSGLLTRAIFESDWISVDSRLKKFIIFFTMRCQRPIKMSALNLFYLSLDTFMKILRTSWSYFALLHQVSSRE